MNHLLIVYYDEYHTPLAALKEALSSGVSVTLLMLQWGEDELDTIPDDVLSTWKILRLDARARFCSGYIVPAVKANARYAESYYLSAALSRPCMAEICAEQLDCLQADTILHGLAGNDQLRFEMAVMALRPSIRIVSVATLLGSRATANAYDYTISSNLWGSSIEAGPLSDPWHAPPTAAFRQILPEVSDHPIPESHVLSFEKGKPIALDGTAMNMERLILELDRLGKKYSVGYTDVVEDGHVGLKTRSLYEAPAATAIVMAHQDLEMLVSTGLQNRFKPLVDKAWAELVYQGYWFDPQRQCLDAYIDSVNVWVTGDVRLRYAPNSLHVDGRRSPHTLYDAERAIYKAGQDFAVDGLSEVAKCYSMAMQQAVARESESIS